MPKSIFKGFEVNPKKKAPIVDQWKIVFNKITDREFNAKLVNAIRCSSDVSQLLLNIINANNTDCVEVNACVNAQLWLPNAWSLTNFVPAVIAAYESHIAAGWADPEFCWEVLACLQTASPAIVDAVAVLINNALATSPNPLLSNLCTYINDCIDSWLLVVSADAWNQITTWTDWWAFFQETLTSISLYEDATDNWIEYIDENLVANRLKTSHTQVISPTAFNNFTITHNLWTTRVHVVAYDNITWYEVDIEVWNRTTNTVDIISTTNDAIEVIVKR